MDNLTHTLIGVAIGESGLRRKIGPGTTWILALASNLPDIDALLLFTPLQDPFLYRRMATHSILGALIIALVATLLFKRWFTTLSPRTLFLLCASGIGLHILFDLMNSYGVVLLYPFSLHRFEFSLLFIIDLGLWIILLVPVLLMGVIKSPGFREKIWLGSVLALVFYLMAALNFKAACGRLLDQKIMEEHWNPSFSYLFPEALGIQRFRGVVKRSEDYELFRINALRKTLVLFKTYHTIEEDPSVKKVRATPRARRLEWFAKAMVWKKSSSNPNGYECFDLRFVSTVLKRKRPFFTFEFSGPELSNPAG